MCCLFFSLREYWFPSCNQKFRLVHWVLSSLRQKKLLNKILDFPRARFSDHTTTIRHYRHKICLEEDFSCGVAHAPSGRAKRRRGQTTSICNTLCNATMLTEGMRDISFIVNYKIFLVLKTKASEILYPVVKKRKITVVTRGSGRAKRSGCAKKGCGHSIIIYFLLGTNCYS